MNERRSMMIATNGWRARKRSSNQPARPLHGWLFASVEPPDTTGPLSVADKIARWREAADNAVKVNAGFAYEGYVRLKFMAVQNYVADLVATLAGVAHCGSPHGRWINQVIVHWCQVEGMHFEDPDAFAMGLPPWGWFSVIL